MEMFHKNDLLPDELKWFGLKVDPFNEVFDEEQFVYPELEALRYQLANAMLTNQVVFLIGDSGSGKSTLIRMAVEEALRTAGDKLKPVWCPVNTARITDVVLDETLLDALRGLSPSNTTSRAKTLRNVMLERHPTFKTALIIDDAHRLHPAVFMHLRTLRQFETARRLLAIVLIGEPGLAMLLKRDDIQNVFGRSRLFPMPPLTAVHEKRGSKTLITKPARVFDFLHHVFERVGHGSEFGQIWSDERAIEMVGELGQYPMNVMNVATLAMKMARRAGSRVVTPEAVNMVGARS